MRPFEQGRVIVRRGIEEQFRAMRPLFCERKIRAFDMDSQQLRAFMRLAPVRVRRLQNGHDLGNRRGDRRERQRRCAAQRVESADRLKRFGGRFHGVAPQRAVEVNVDESRREILATEFLDQVARLRLQHGSNGRNPPIRNPKIAASLDAVGENQPGILE